MTQDSHLTLLIIDPQNDFVRHDGALSVAGAEEDALRLARLIEGASNHISSVSLSLDSHQRFDISHPIWYFDAEGRSPEPFSVITAEDLTTGRWRVRPEVEERTLHYVHELEKRSRYPHLIWPEHCLIGSEGHGVYPVIQEALHRWAARPARIDYIFKGQNPFTEHFSAVEAEVPDPQDPNTQTNQALIQRLQESDQIWVAGWARSHCVGNTLYDLFRIGGKELAEKTTLVADAMSDVPGFTSQGEAVTQTSIEWGARVADVDTILSQLT
jgi:nicotinamidase-related amidase